MSGGALEMETLINEVEGYILEELEKQKEDMIDYFRHIGEQCISIARVKVQALPKDYADWSGALRSSIGYAILLDGKLVEKPTIVPATRENREGGKRAREYIKELQEVYNDGLVLVVVAGMEYASYVQAKGFDVLTSAELKMDEQLGKMVAFYAKKWIKL